VLKPSEACTNLLAYLHHFGPMFVARARNRFDERAVRKVQRSKFVETVRIIGGEAVRINANGSRAIGREPNGMRVTDWHAAISIAAVRSHLENDCGYVLQKGYPKGIYLYRSPETERGSSVGVAIVPRSNVVTPTALAGLVDKYIERELLGVDWLEVWSISAFRYKILPTKLALKSGVVPYELNRVPDGVPCDRIVVYR
jgi:hypothetical protein